MSNTCRTCKFWEPTSHYTKNSGCCDMVHHWKTLAEIKVHVSDDSGLEVKFVTNENFGCNQYEFSPN